MTSLTEWPVEPLQLKANLEVLVFLKVNGTKNQVVLSKYNLKNLDMLLIVSFTFTIITYTFFAIAGDTINIYGTKNLIYSLPFVLYGMMRYLRQIRIKEDIHFSEIALFKDKRIIFNNFIWLSIILWNVYL